MGEQDRGFFQEGKSDGVSMTMTKILLCPGEGAPVGGCHRDAPLVLSS